MEYPSYSLTTDESNYVYEFISKGKSQSIKKLIIFTPLNDSGLLFNLSFGNKLNTDNALFRIDDKALSNNGDMKKILATVFRAINEFTKDRDYFKIVFRGSTASRTRLYRMAISINYEELSKYYVIYGLTQHGAFVFFEKNKDYSAFLITPI